MAFLPFVALVAFVPFGGRGGAIVVIGFLRALVQPVREASADSALLDVG